MSEIFMEVARSGRDTLCGPPPEAVIMGHTQSDNPRPDDPAVGRRAERDAPEGGDEADKRRKIEQQLDEALAATFPASDPVSIVTSQEEEDWGTDPVTPEPRPPVTHAGVGRR
jgi:hypothetical protein